MDSVTWYRYARFYSSSTPWIVRRPNKKVFSSENRKEKFQKATRLCIFIMTIAAFWFAFFKLFIGDFYTETYFLAAGSSVAFSFFGKGWGMVERLLK